VRLVSTRLQSGQTVVHAYGDGAPPEPGFEHVDPELEDVYFSSIAGYVGEAVDVPAVAA